MQPWCWRWVEWLLQRHLPPLQRLTTLGDLAEDFHASVSAKGRLRAEVRLLREASAVASAYQHRHLQHHERTSVMERLRFPETRLAVRRLVKQPGASLASVATLAGAFAAALATWILLDAVLLSPIPAHDPESLVVIGQRAPDAIGVPGRLSTAHLFTKLADVRATGVFERTAAIGLMPALAGEPNRRVRATIAFVTHDFFETLGVPIQRGPGFGEADDRPGAPLVVILSDRYWQRERDSNPAIVGTTMAIGDRTATIVGVTPPRFRGLSLANAPDLFVPVQSVYDVMGRNQDFLALGIPRTSPSSIFTIVGRLPETTTAQQAGAGLQRLITNPRQGTMEAIPIATAAIPEAVRPDMERFTSMLGATVGLLLLIGSLTVGLLLLIRSEARREEFAMCLALGATRGRLFRGILAEGFVLSLTGLALAVPLTVALLVAARTFELPGQVSVDRLAMTVGPAHVLTGLVVALVSTVLIGLVARLAGVGGNIADMLRARTGATPRLTRRRTRQGLIMTQVAVTVVLLVGTGLFGRSLMAALRLNAGYDTDRLVTTDLRLGAYGYSPARAQQFFSDFETRLRGHAATQSVGAVLWWGGMGGGSALTIDGADRKFPSAVSYIHIDANYFSTIGLRTIRGRDFSSDDSSSSSLVGIVSESFGRMIALGGDPVGHTITEYSNAPGKPKAVVRIVGVVPDVVTDVTELEPLVLYYSMAQKRASPDRTFVVRASSPAAMTAAIRQAVVDLDPGVTPGEIATMTDRIARQMAPQRFGLSVLGALASVALLLTLLGTYVIAETMAKARERELGVRAALGATRQQLGGLVVRETVVLVGLGLVCGLGLTWLASETVQSLLYQVEPLDTVTLVSTAGLMLLTAVLVSARPALRAARIDVAALLRE